MKLVQITSPSGAVYLLNMDQIKIIIPFENGLGCTIQMVGDGEDKLYKVGTKYDDFIKSLSEFDVSICYPVGVNTVQEPASKDFASVSDTKLEQVDPRKSLWHQPSPAEEP